MFEWILLASLVTESEMPWPRLLAIIAASSAKILWFYSSDPSCTINKSKFLADQFTIILGWKGNQFLNFHASRIQCISLFTWRPVSVKRCFIFLNLIFSESSSYAGVERLSRNASSNSAASCSWAPSPEIRCSSIGAVHWSSCMPRSIAIDKASNQRW